jgi:hypothetical protein
MRPSAALSPGQGVLRTLQQRGAADGGVAGGTRFMTELLQAAAGTEATSVQPGTVVAATESI